MMIIVICTQILRSRWFSFQFDVLICNIESMCIDMMKTTIFYVTNVKRMKLKFTMIMVTAAFHAGMIWQILRYRSPDLSLFNKNDMIIQAKTSVKW